MGSLKTPVIFYFDTAKLGVSTHCIVYSNDINNDKFKVQMNQAGFIEDELVTFNVDNQINGNIILHFGDNDKLVRFCQFQTEASDWDSSVRFVTSLVSIGGVKVVEVLLHHTVLRPLTF